MPKRVVFLSTGAAFALAPLRALLEAGHQLAGLLMPASVPGIPLPRRLAGSRVLRTVEEGVRETAWSAGVPVHEVGALGEPATRALVAKLRPDLLVVACYPHRLPPALLRSAPGGGLNLHPSLLPAYRGPAPLFFQLRAGETRTGVTVHVMDEGLDTGPILAQAEVPLPEGARAVDLERLLGESASRLLVACLCGETAVGRPQPEAGASRQSWPQAADLEIEPPWPARRAFNFVRGAREHGPFEVLVPGARLRVADARELREGDSLGRAFERRGDSLLVAFADGVVELVEVREGGGSRRSGTAVRV